MSPFAARSAPLGLYNLSPALRSQKRSKRVGRGQGSGYGGTSGRGHKGQNARSGNGKPTPGFEGGQTPLARRFPKRGFHNFNERNWAPLNLDRLQHWIVTGRLVSSKDKPIRARDLLLSGCVHDVQDGIKLLGQGATKLNTKIYINPARASQTAIKAVERAGGSVVCTYQNTLALQNSIRQRFTSTDAAPTRKSDILWYTRWKNRGYLAPNIVSKLPDVSGKLKQLSQTLRGVQLDQSS